MNTVLITGGGSGIGWKLAERYLKQGDCVIICGRNEQKLADVQAAHPEVITRKCDLTNEAERIALVDWISTDHPETNILVNNAGIQQRFNLLKADVRNNWDYYLQEIKANEEATIHLAILFSQLFVEKEQATIVNVSSGLAIIPMVISPIYSASKAAVHAFTMALRHQLSETAIKVIEILPPAVNTDLGGTGLHNTGEDADEFADSVFRDMQAGKEEIGFAHSAKVLEMSRKEINETVAGMYQKMKAEIE